MGVLHGRTMRVRATAFASIALLLAAQTGLRLASGTFAGPSTKIREKKMKHGVVLLLVVITACAAPNRSVTGATSPVLLPVKADELRRDLFAFAADSFQGRETGTPYATRAARFLVERLVSLGAEP